MITFERENNKFNFRVSGIAIHNNRLLLHTTLTDDFWNLPGGRVEFNESTDQTIIREFKARTDEEFLRIEEGGKLIFKWFPLEKLDQLHVYPDILKTELLNLKDKNQIKHYINNEYQSSS